MAINLRYDLRTAYESGAKEHPQKVTKKLGITYEDATPESISDQWFFWNCDNLPVDLPNYIEIVN